MLFIQHLYEYRLCGFLFPVAYGKESLVRIHFKGINSADLEYWKRVRALSSILR